MEIREHIKEGKHSGYSWCCITWFILTREIFKINSFLANTKYWRHVPCPIHAIICKNPKYNQCGYCGWIRFGYNLCNICKDEKLKVEHIQATICQHRELLKVGIYYKPYGSAYKQILESVENYSNHRHIEVLRIEG